MSEPISFVCWKWHTPGTTRAFRSEHVNVLRGMVARWYKKPFRFICITDDPAGLDESIEAIPMPVSFDKLRNPAGDRFPNCYRRLWNFSREARAVLGSRIFQIDIDVIIAGDITELAVRNEDFVGWRDGRFQKNKIAGGAYLLRTGSLPEIWEAFDPERSPQEAAAAGYDFGSDQAWISYKLQGNQRIGAWEDDSGIYKINWFLANSARPPADARIVFTNGLNPPWSPQAQAKYPWLVDYWRGEDKPTDRVVNE